MPKANVGKEATGARGTLRPVSVCGLGNPVPTLQALVGGKLAVGPPSRLDLLNFLIYTINH